MQPNTSLNNCELPPYAYNHRARVNPAMAMVMQIAQATPQIPSAFTCQHGEEGRFNDETVRLSNETLTVLQQANNQQNDGVYISNINTETNGVVYSIKPNTQQQTIYENDIPQIPSTSETRVMPQQLNNQQDRHLAQSQRADLIAYLLSVPNGNFKSIDPKWRILKENYQALSKKIENCTSIMKDFGVSPPQQDKYFRALINLSKKLNSTNFISFDNLKQVIEEHCGKLENKLATKIKTQS